MRSSSGFNRTSSSPQRYYGGSIQAPISQQYGYPAPASSSYGRQQNNYAGLIGGTQYLHPQAGLSSVNSSMRPVGSSYVSVPPSVSYNNFIDPRASSYQTGSYSPPRIIQAPSIATATKANQLPPQSQAVYRQSSAAEGGFYNPNQFESSQIQKTLNTTQMIRKYNNNTGTNGQSEQLNEIQQDRIRVYKKGNVEKVFGRGVTIECNYEPHKLFSTKELRGFLVDGFKDFEVNLQKLEQRFSGLESSFYHLLHKGDTPKDIFDRFLVTLDRRVEKFFESFDETVIQGKGLATEYFDTNIMRNDFEFWNFKSVVKQGVIEVSNKLNDLFVARENSTYYDAQIIRCLETIVKLFQFLKSDLSTVLNKSLLKSGKILEACTYNFENGEGLKTINFAEFVQLDVASLIAQYSEEFERSYPVLLNKKQIVTEKFHDILKDKQTQNPFDLKQLVRGVFQRERRKLYRTIYNAIIKNGKSELDLDEEMLAENKSITDKMNKIKSRFLTIKNDPLYLEVLSGRMNAEYLKNSPTLFEENSQTVLFLEKFMVNTQQFFEDIKDNLSDIVYYKQKEQDRNKQILSNILSRAVYDLNQHERLIQDKGDMSELILYQFQVLEKSLHSDHSRQNVDTALESTLMKQLKNNQANYHLHNVAADLARQEKQKEEQRKVIQENQVKKSKEYSQQIANLMTKPLIDKERTQYPVKDNYKNYEDEDQYDEKSSSSLKGLADKLLQTIKQKREEDFDKERKLKEEQEEVRYMKERQYQEERERLAQEKQRMIDHTTKKFNQKREQEQSEFDQRMKQKQLDEQERKDRENERQREDEYKKQKVEDDRRRQREQQDELRRAREEEENEKRRQDDEKRRQRDDDMKRQKDEDERRRQQDREDQQRRQKEEDDRRRKDEEDRKKQREIDDQKRKQKDEEDRKKQHQADEDRRKRAEEEENRRQDEQKRKDEQRRIQQEEDDQRRKQQQEDEKRRQEDLKRQKEEDDRIKRQKQEDDDRKRKQDDDDRKRKREEEDRKKDEEKKKQEDERKRQKEEDDRKRKQEEEDRKQRLKDEDDRKKKEEEERRKKEDDDRKKKEEERKKKEEEDRKKKEEDDRKRKEEDDRRKKEEDDRKRKQREEEEDRERKRKQDEEDKMLKKLKEQEEAAEAAATAKKLQEEQNKKNQKGSGVNYGDYGSEDSGSQYKDDFDIEDLDEIDTKNNAKNSKTNEPAKSNQLFNKILIQ